MFHVAYPHKFSHSEDVAVVDSGSDIRKRPVVWG